MGSALEPERMRTLANLLAELVGNRLVLEVVHVLHLVVRLLHAPHHYHTVLTKSDTASIAEPVIHTL